MCVMALTLVGVTPGGLSDESDCKSVDSSSSCAMMKGWSACQTR
jgi:hypothetical protein